MVDLYLIVGFILGIPSALALIILWEKTVGKWMTRRRWREYQASATLFCTDPNLAAGIYEVERGRGGRRERGR